MSQSQSITRNEQPDTCGPSENLGPRSSNSVSTHRSGGPRRVVMFVPLFLPHIGGVERHVDRIARGLNERGWSVSIVTVKHEPTLPDRENLDGVSLHRIPRPRRFLVWLWIIRHLSLMSRAEVIHCHDYLTFYKWFLPFRFLLFWIPVYVTFHGFEGYPVQPSVIRRRKLVAALSNGYFCVGRYLSKWYGTECTRVLIGATDCSPDPAIKREENRLVILGRLEQDTSPMGVLEAVQILKERHGTKLVVDVCGDGALRHSLENYANSHDLQVTFHGTVSEMVPFLSRARFVIASGYLSMLDAMACGATVLAYAPNPLRNDYWSIEDLDGGALTVSMTPDELADSLHRLSTEPRETENKTRKGMDFARSQSWEYLVNQYLDLFGVRL